MNIHLSSWTFALAAGTAAAAEHARLAQLARPTDRDDTSTETGLVDSWDPKGGPGSNLLWKNTDLGGRSTPIVMSGQLYTLVRDQPGHTDLKRQKWSASMPPPAKTLGASL